MNPLGDALERFNRKERNLLIRDILNCRGKTPPLAGDFCERLAKAVGISKESLDSAWWATDFHIDWLAGGLLTFMKGETTTPQDNRSMLVMGNQEDIDLVVVAHGPAAETLHHLILIEAKAYGHFTTKQYRSKIARLERLHEFYSELEKSHRIRSASIMSSTHRQTYQADPEVTAMAIKRCNRARTHTSKVHTSKVFHSFRDEMQGQEWTGHQTFFLEMHRLPIARGCQL
jgi:hypothetical protein